MYVKESFLFRKDSKAPFKSPFIHCLFKHLKEIMSQKGLEPITLVRDDTPNKAPTAVTIKADGQEVVLQFIPWSQSENVLKLLKGQVLSCEEVLFNAASGNLCYLYSNQIIPIASSFSQDPFIFRLEGKRDQLCRKPLKELEQLFDLSNLINLSSLNYQIEITDEFRQYLKEAHQQPRNVDFFELAVSDQWYKNFVGLINNRQISQDKRTISPIPWRPQHAKKLLEMFQLAEAAFKGDCQVNGFPGNEAGPQALASTRLLALAMAVVGDLLGFREARTYFRGAGQPVLGSLLLC
jgi:hypothetical protein